jgi:hypothetical protein
MEKELNNQITKWLKNDPVYSSGLALLVQVCKNKFLVRNLSRKNTPKNLNKIRWELRKSIGDTAFSSSVSVDAKKKISAAGSSASQAGEKLREIFLAYPETIQSLIKTIGDLSSNRDKLHRKLKEIPEANTNDNIAKRKEIREFIQDTSELLEHYYQLKDRFFKEKIVPTPEDLKFTKEDKSKKKTKPINPIKDMSEADLVKKLQNLRSNLTKKKNKILYQSVSKKDKENPMPEGAKRDHLSAQIKTDEKQIKEIQKRLDAFNKAK